jgi:MFS family permease
MGESRALTAAAATGLPIRRNTFLLGAAMAVYSAVLQLVAAVSSITFVLVTGIEGLLGLGPAIFLAASGLAALPAGRAMDQFGRKPVVAGGFAAAALGCSLTALTTNLDSAPLLILGFALTGAASGIALLIRTAAGDMYPPERRARGISYVLFGSVFGAILGPAVFGPLFAGRELEASTLTPPWLAAGALSLVALGLVLLVRPDPQRIAVLIAAGRPAGTAPATAAPLREILLRPGVRPAMLAAFASFGVMVSVMNLSGYVVVEHHHHPQHSVFPVIGAHVAGMYALVLVVGPLVDHVGRLRAMIAGLLVMGASTIGLLWLESVLATAVLLFGLGVGWNLSFVAATAQLSDRAGASERGRLLGFTDLLSALLGAGLALLGGYALDSIGVAALALGATALVAAPALWLLPRAGRRASEAPAA